MGHREIGPSDHREIKKRLSRRSSLARWRLSAPPNAQKRRVPGNPLRPVVPACRDA